MWKSEAISEGVRVGEPDKKMGNHSQLTYVKAALVDDRKRPNVHSMCSMAKLIGSSLAGDLARDAIQICVGYGLVKELAATGEQFPLEAIYRDCKIGEIYEGANEIQRMVIARGIFGKDIVG